MLEYPRADALFLYGAEFDRQNVRQARNDLRELRVQTPHCENQRGSIKGELAAHVEPHQALDNLLNRPSDHDHARVRPIFRQQPPKRRSRSLACPCIGQRKPRLDIGQAADMAQFLMRACPLPVGQKPR